MSKKFVYGDLSKLKKTSIKSGSIGQFLSKFGHLKIDGFFVTLNGKVEYTDWGNKNSENLCIVKKGVGKISFGGKSYNLTKDHVFKVYPGQEPTIFSNKGLSVISIQKPSSFVENKYRKINLSKLELIDTRKIKQKVYEFETLAQEVCTPDYKDGIGVIKFVFVNPIPLHWHPLSDRIILPTKGKGVVYIEPNIYESNEDTFAVFGKNVVHTNGPLTGRKLYMYAVHLPWIPSEIDQHDIAGSIKFVRYTGITPPKKLWKTKKGMEKLIKILET